MPDVTRVPFQTKQDEQREYMDALAVMRGLVMEKLGVDWWKVVAAVLFDKPASEVTKDERTAAKHRFFERFVEAAGWKV